MTDTTERPIIFSGPMVRAILDGRKTQTRRIVKLPDNAVDVIYYAPPSGRSEAGWADPGVRYLVPDPEDSLPPGFPDEIELWPHSLYIDPCPYGEPGDRLYVREAWAHDGPDLATVRAAHEDAIPGVGYGPYYRATESAPDTLRWRPSIHMPKWAARIRLEVTGVRVERVQDISEDDAVAEGFGVLNGRPDSVYQRWDSDPMDEFCELWDSLNAKRAPWDSNPWVWVIEFRTLSND